MITRCSIAIRKGILQWTRRLDTTDKFVLVILDLLATALVILKLGGYLDLAWWLVCLPWGLLLFLVGVWIGVDYGWRKLGDFLGDD